MNTLEVLLVEDDAALREGLAEYFALAGYSVNAVGSGLECFAALSRPHQLRVAVIDLGLPDIDGQRLVAHLRQHTQIKIIVLTAKREPNTSVESYEAGADLYMSKPVNSRELVAAIQSLARRAEQAVSEDTSQTNKKSQSSVWKLSKDEWILFSPSDVALKLTSREFAFINQLACAPGSIISRGELCQALYKRHDFSAEAALSTLVKRIRQRIAQHQMDSSLIQTSHGVGYRFAGSVEII